MEELNFLLTAYNNETNDNKYHCISKIRKVLHKKPELRRFESHEIFTTMISFHIEVMQRELDSVRNFLDNRENAVLDEGLHHAPYSVYEGYLFLNKKLGERLVELELIIEEYKIELNRRKKIKAEQAANRESEN